MKLLDLSFNVGHIGLSSIDEYLDKSYSNITYAKYLTKKYLIKFIFHCDKDEVKNIDKIEYVFRNNTRGSKFIFPLRLALKVRKMNPDIIITHSILYIHFAAMLRLFLPSKTIIIVQNHAEKLPRSGLKKWIVKISDKHINGYLFTSLEMAKPWLDSKLFSSSEKVFEVMEGSTGFKKKDKSRCRKILNIPQYEKVFIWVGRLDSNKDPLTVIKAFKQYVQNGHSFKLYMFYHTEKLLPDIINYINTNKLQGHIILKGKAPHAELESWYSASDFYISASHYEGSGYALCEAMACGCIPVVTNIPSFKFMTNSGKAGFLYEKGNDKDLCEKLDRISQIDVNEKEKDVINVYNERLSFEAIANRIDSAILSLKK